VFEITGEESGILGTYPHWPLIPGLPFWKGLRLTAQAFFITITIVFDEDKQ